MSAYHITDGIRPQVARGRNLLTRRESRPARPRLRCGWLAGWSRRSALSS